MHQHHLRTKVQQELTSLFRIPRLLSASLAQGRDIPTPLIPAYRPSPQISSYPRGLSLCRQL